MYEYRTSVGLLHLLERVVQFRVLFFLPFGRNIFCMWAERGTTRHSVLLQSQRHIDRAAAVRCRSASCRIIYYTTYSNVCMYVRKTHRKQPVTTTFHASFLYILLIKQWCTHSNFKINIYRTLILSVWFPRRD